MKKFLGIEVDENEVKIVEDDGVIRVYNKNGNGIYYEDSSGYWVKYEYDKNGNEIYYENSNGYWAKSEYDKNGNKIYYEDSDGNDIEDAI